MRGRVKMFNETKGFGFILGENEEDYFFHISKVKSVEPIVRGMMVSFLPTKGEKGNIADDVRIENQSNSKAPQFITFGNERMKMSNIKDYGIATGNACIKKKFLSGEENTVETIKSFLVFLDPDLATTESVEKKSYLYVTTYQNDNYEFWEHEANFDIFEKCKELDSYFTRK